MQQHGSKYFSRRPSPTSPTLDLNSAFSEQSHVVYQMKRTHQGSNSVANILPTYPPVPGGGVKMSKFNFFRAKSCLIKRIQGNHKCSNRVANILPTDPPPHTHTHSLADPRNEFKIQLSQNMVILHIKSKGITNAATQ